VTARNRTAVVALTVVALVALVYVLRLVLSNDALLLEHVSERRTELTEIALWAGADPNYRDDDGLPQRFVSLAADIEAQLGVPVVSSDISLYWRIFRTLGVEPLGRQGSLLASLQSGEEPGPALER